MKFLAAFLMAVLGVLALFVGIVAVVDPPSPPLLIDGMVTQARDPRTINDGTPPIRFRKDSGAVVWFVSPRDLQMVCGGDAPVGMVYAGCQGEKDGIPIIAVPNPCLFDNEPYAHVLCHELGHRNGWPGTHGP